MKNIKYFAVAILLAVLAVPPVFAGYSTDGSSTTSGESFWNSEILRLSADLSGTSLTLTVTKKDGGEFKSSGTVYFKVGSPQTFGAVRDSTSVSEGVSSRSYSHDLDDYDLDGYPKEFYVRYEGPDDTWAWVGPIEVSYEADVVIEPTPVTDTKLPTGEVSGIDNTYTAGDRVYYSVRGWDNESLYKLNFGVTDNSGEKYNEVWNVDGTSANESDSFSTSGWSAGTYYYALWVKDVADNAKEYTGSFSLEENTSLPVVDDSSTQPTEEPQPDDSQPPITTPIDDSSTPPIVEEPQPDDSQPPVITTGIKKIGNLDVYADVFEQDANNLDIFVAKGNVMLARANGKKVLSVGTDLKMDYVGNTVESIGQGDLIALNIKYNPNELAQKFLLYSGSFTANASDNPSVLQINVDLPLKLAGLPPAFSPKITLNGDEVILRDVAAYIIELSNTNLNELESDIKFTVGDIVLSQTGNSTAEIKIAVGIDDTSFHLFKKKWNLSSVEIGIDLLEKSVTGSADFSIPGIFGTANDGIGVTLGFAYGSFWPNTFGASISSDKIPRLPASLRTIPTTPPSPLGALINKLSLLADNMSSSRALQLTGGIGMSLTDLFGIIPSLEGKIGFRILSGDLALLADLSGKVELSGKVDLLETLHLGNAKIGFGNPTYVEGNINLIDVLTGKLRLDFSALPNYVEGTGQAKGNLKVPDITPWIGGEEPFAVNMEGTLRFNSSEIDRAEFATNVSIFFIDVGVRIDISDLKDPHLYVTGLGKAFKIRKATRKNRTNLQTIVVTSDYNAVIIKADSENSAALFNITLPDGTVYTSDSTPTPDSPDVDNIFFRRNEAAHEAYYAIKQPAQGEYTVEVLNAADIGEYQVELWTPNIKPTITLDTLATDQVWDGVSPVEITWTDGDPDNNAEISLYYDTDDTGNNGALIAIGIMEDDANNVYQWNIEPNTQSGSYYVYAKIDDREHAPIFSYSSGKIIVNNPNAPTAPQNVVLTPGDGSITVNWDANTEDNLMGYRVYLSETLGNNVFEYDFGVGLTANYEIQGLVNGKTYEVAVSAVNDETFVSHLSTSLQVTPNGTTPSGSPDVLINTEESSLDSDTLQIRVENAGEFQLTSARMAFYQEATLVDFQMIGPLPAGEFQDITFQLDSEISENVLVKVDEVIPSELRTFNNIAIIKPTPTSYNVGSYIYDESGTPLAGVTVEVNGNIVVTDENGYFQIEGIVEGTYTLTASKEGYQFAPITVVVGGNNSEITLTDLVGISLFEPRIIIAKETGHNKIVITDSEGEVINWFSTFTSGNDINVATGDFDDDGEDEIAVNVSKQVLLYKMDSEGENTLLFLIDQEGDIATGDIDGDGLPEFFTTSKAANTNSVSIYAYDGTLLKTVNIDSLGKNTKLSIATADTNGDGTVEIIAGDLKGDQVAIYSVDGTEINTFTVFQDTNTRRSTVRKPGDNGNACDHKGKGRPKFCDEPEPPPVEEPTPPSEPEPVVTEPVPVVTEPTPPSEPEPVVTEPVPVVTEPTPPSEPEPVVTEPVPVVTEPTPLNKPEKPKPNKPAKPSKPKKNNGVKVAAGDTNGDGVPEIIVGMASKGSTVEIYNIAGERQQVFATVLNNNGIEIAAGDVNKDGKDDVIVGDAKGTKVLVFDLDGQIGQFQGLDSKNIASIAFGKGAVEIVNPFPPEQPPVVDDPTVEIPTDEQSTETPTDGQPTDTPTDVPVTSTDGQPTDTPTDVPAIPTDGQPTDTPTDVPAIPTDGQATVSADGSENSTVTDDVATTDEEPPVIVEDEQKDEPIGPPVLPPPPTTGDISGTRNYGGETLTDATIEAGANIAKVNIAGETTNEGRLSNITVSDGATLQGGIISGDLANEGIVKDITFVGRKLEGGEFGGTLNIESDAEIGLGTVGDVTLLADTQVKGGIFEGTVAGDADSKALIEAAKFDSEAKLANVIIGQDCEIEEDVEIGTGVRFTDNDSIPEATDLSAALTTDGEIDFSTDVVTDAPSLLTQINDLPDMQDNDWQLEQNDGRLEVMVDGTRMRVKPKRVKQAKRNRRAAIIIHGDGTVTVITAKGREILVEVQVVE